MNVLIAVDDSAESLDAVDTAVRLFGDRADYHVVAVGGQPLMYVGGFAAGSFPSAADIRYQVEAARTSAEHAAQQARERLPDATVAQVEDGAAGPTICDAAAEHDSDVLVIGSHHRSFWERLIDPSVGRYLIEHAPCPVLVVR